MSTSWCEGVVSYGNRRLEIICKFEMACPFHCSLVRYLISFALDVDEILNVSSALKTFLNGQRKMLTNVLEINRR